MSFRKHDIVDYFDTRRIACGLILEVDEKRLRILTDQGKEANIPPSRALIAAHDPNFPVAGSRDVQVSRLREICLQREQMKNSIDLPELWEVVSPETSEIDVHDLTDLFFGSEHDANRAASLLRAVHEDRIYFRIRPDTIEVAAPERVEQALVQRTRERERREFLARSAEFLAGLKNGPGADVGSPPPGLTAMLEEAAAAGREWGEVKAVKDIFVKAGLPSGWNPFRVLVKLGIWSEDENVTLRTEHVPVEFPPEVEKKAREVSAKALPLSSEDLSHEDLITIDSAQTRDVDDAISLSYEGDDAIVGIHITDVYHYVDEDPLLHEELRERATSIYLPEATIPMLPPILSEETASLVEGELRPAVSILVRVGPDLQVKDHRIVESLVKVRERLSYEDAADRIADSSSKEAVLFRIAQALRKTRESAGAVIFKDPELSVRLTVDRIVEVKIRERETPSQVLVSEMMILANTLFARFLHERGVPAIFRSQPPPLEKIDLGEGYDPVLSYRAKKVLSRGDIGTQPSPHSTLGVGLYTTATSPLRRFIDLLVQGQLKAAIKGTPPPFDVTRVEQAIAEISYRLERATAMERERQRYFLLKYLEQRRSQEFEAVVLQRFPRFYLVQITSLCLNAALMASSTLSLNPHDRVQVRIDKIDPREDKLNLALVRLL